MTVSIQQATFTYENDGNKTACARIRDELNRFNNHRIRLSPRKVTEEEYRLESTLQPSQRNFYESSYFFIQRFAIILMELTHLRDSYLL